jgi:predicted amino acid-binding ACT domain protein
MMDSSVLLWIINALMAIVLWFTKGAISDIKEQIVENRQKLEVVKETYYKKADFTEFKAELWARLDKMETDFQRALDKK